MTNQLETTADFHGDQKQRHGCWRTCCLSLFVAILLVVGSGAWLLARSGLVTVPSISTLAYHQPQPQMTVTTTPDTLTGLTKRLEQQSAALAGGTIELAVSQEELSAAFRQKNPDVTVSFANKTIEWFGPYRLEQVTLYLTIQAEPTIDAGRLRFVIRGAKIGQLPLPASLLNIVGQQLQEKFVDPNPFIKQITFESIRIEHSNLIIRANLPPDIGQNLKEE